MTDLAALLTQAKAFWGNTSGGRTMGIMADKGVQLLGAEREASSLTAQDGTKLITALEGANLSPAYVRSVYSATRRVLALGGLHTVDWPKPGKAPRVKSREPIPEEDLARLLGWLRCQAWDATADLGLLMSATGLRVNVEARTGEHIEVMPGEDFDTLRVTGKGGHERFIPVVDPEARALLRSPDRLKAMRRTPYNTHLDRWKKGVAALGIKSRLATPHAVRHGYASKALALSGGNLSMVQELLGHSDPATTARYLHTDLTAKARMLGGLNSKPHHQQ